MKFQLVAVGHKMPAWIADGFSEYAQRMPRESRIELTEIKPAVRGKSGGETAAAAAGAPADLREFNNSLLSLEYLREWPDAEEIKGELVRFNGVGPKTAGEFSFLFFFFFPVQIKCDINTDKKKPTTTTTKKKKRSTQHVSSSLP